MFKWIKKLIGFIVFIFVLIYLASNIIFPSYASMRTNCDSGTLENNARNVLKGIPILEDRYEMQIQGIASSRGDKIELTQGFETVENIETLVHELCHIKQVKENRLEFCNETSGRLERFLDESECYTKQEIFSIGWDRN